MADTVGLTITERKVAASPDGTRADWLGVVCSAGCAIHCAAMPILLAMLPSFSSIRFLADPAFHQMVAGLCVILVIRAIWPQWKRHRDWRVGGAAVIGLMLLVLAAFVLPDRCCDRGNSTAQTSVGTAVARMPVSLASTERRITDDLGDKSPSNTPTRSSVAGPSRDNVKRQTFASIAGHWRRPVISLTTLRDWLGTDAAQVTALAQPYLSPLGGVFLIIAHLLNLSLRRGELECCRAE